MTQKLIILGTGGNCLDILDAVNEIRQAAGGGAYECVGFLDDEPASRGKEHCGVKVLGPLDAAGRYGDCLFVNGIGSPASFWRKPDILAKTRMPPERFATIIHPAASVSPSARIGRGTVVLQNVAIASNARIGDHVIILPNSVLGHDCVIGDYTCIAGAVCVSGRVTVGRCCYLGAGSAIRENTRIADRCLLGMGSVVLADVPENTVVAGNPAKYLRKTTDREA